MRHSCGENMKAIKHSFHIDMVFRRGSPKHTHDQTSAVLLGYHFQTLAENVY